MSGIGTVILAAGRGSRFGAGQGESKLLAQLGGTPLVRHVATAALRATPRPIVVVTGHAATQVEHALAGLSLGFIRNPDPAAGLSQSLKLGLAQLPQDISGALILLGDMPFVSATLINRLAAAFEAAAPGTSAVVPVCAGRRGNPVLLGKDLFAEVRQLQGDHGARGLIDALSDGVIEVSTDEAAIMLDIDTPDMLEDLNRLHGERR